jgi:hypothetical protein
MKNITYIYFLFILTFSAGAQSIEELKSTLTSTKNPFIKPESLDGIMISLRKYENNPLPDQDSLMLEIYRTVSSAYVANNHFKQGYQVFNSYLLYKENMLAKDKSKAINTAMNVVGERARNDETDQLNLQHQLSELKAENISLGKRVVAFKSNFSLILILLSVVFAVILAGYGIRSFSLRSRLHQNRSTMKNIHHLALAGRFEEGVRNALQNSIKNLEIEIGELKRSYKI